MIKRLKKLPFVYTMGSCVVLGIIAGLFISTVLITKVQVYGESMEPTYYTGDKVFISKISTPNRGDCVVIEEGGKHLIKRVIGLPGETIQISEGKVFIDGVYLEEPYMNPSAKDGYDAGIAYEEVKLDSDEYFIMGDNRLESKDSRIIGPVIKEHITGVVICGN